MVRIGVFSTAARMLRFFACIPFPSLGTARLTVMLVCGVLAPTVHSSGQAGHAAIFF
jgi:hypothetical protein